jgi:hypothetical protein
MAEIVNLRRARKAKGREEAEKRAAENRARFGKSKSERKTIEAQAALDQRRLDGHRRLPADESES